MKYTGPGSGIKGALISFILGSAAAGPLYAAFPVAAMMLKKAARCSMSFCLLAHGQPQKFPC